jgi:hypothetical protein
MVLGGAGTVQVRQPGEAWRTVKVSGVPRSYEVVSGAGGGAGSLDVRVTPGVDVYSFTFG